MSEADAAEPYWADRIFGDEPVGIHQVEPARYLDVYERTDGRLLFDECWREAFLVADPEDVVELEAWR